MKKVYLIGALLSFGLLAEAQSFMRFEDKAFNFGAKVGFNATFPVINSLSINGKEAENIEVIWPRSFAGSISNGSSSSLVSHGIVLREISVFPYLKVCRKIICCPIHRQLPTS
mgnify:CR=1 FL=1